MKLIRLLVVIVLVQLACVSVSLAADEPSRIIAIGDVHGDYDQFIKLLRTVGLINRREDWIGGDAQLVQLGDLADRGPDTRKIMDLLIKLESGSKKSDGNVTVLIGNHEEMNLGNDLRYVHPGEYQAFVDSRSGQRRDAYYQQTIDHLTKTLSKRELPKFDKAYRADWNTKYPLGYLEHRMAWTPTGQYGKWVISNDSVGKLGDTLFVHGGLSSKYPKVSLSEINTRVRSDLIQPNDKSKSIAIDDDGPLWYRGWASLPETADNQAELDGVLAAFDVKRMVIAHTPVLPIVFPRFNGKVIVADVGLSAHYGSGFAALEIVDGRYYALVGGARIELPGLTDGNQALLDYFIAAEKYASDPAKVARYRRALEADFASGTAPSNRIKSSSSSK